MDASLGMVVVGATVVVGAVGAGYLLGRHAGLGASQLGHRAPRSRSCSRASEEAQSKASASLRDGDDDDAIDSDAEYESAGEPHKMVMVVRMDLKMGKGKIAAQCCHAAVGCYRHAPADALRAWFTHGQAKIALKCKTEEELMQVAAHAEALGLNRYVVCDAGRTQIAAGSYTVCGIGPAPKSQIDRVTSSLKLL